MLPTLVNNSEIRQLSNRQSERASERERERERETEREREGMSCLCGRRTLYIQDYKVTISPRVGWRVLLIILGRWRQNERQNESERERARAREREFIATVG